MEDTRELTLRKLQELYKKEEVTENPEICAKLLGDLANCHQNTDKWSYVCKCALLNGAFLGTNNYNAKESIKNQLRDLGKSLLCARNHQHPENFDIVEFSLKVKDKFSKKRKAIAKNLNELQPIPNETCGNDLFVKENEIIHIVRHLMKEISEFYSERMGEISLKCIEVLGQPPCEFSHFAMGSLARQEITLYSDFENAIVLGDGVDWKDECSRHEAIEYFRWYAVLFDMILINFGETPISLLGIDGLNDHYSIDKTSNWFYDTFIACGIMFDSFLPFASKNPFGRKPTYEKPEGADLILPVNEMLQYLTEHKTLQEGYHLTNMLLESKHIAGNVHVFERFRSGYLTMAAELRKSIPFIEQDLCYTRENLMKFNLSPTFSKLGWSQHAKKSFYRPISVHMSFISRLCGVFGYPSSSQIVETLKQDSGLSESATHCLLYALAISNLVRLKVYSDRSKQSDHLTGAVNLIDNTTNIMNIFDAVGDRIALDFYEIALGVSQAVEEIAEVLDDKIRDNASIDGSIAIDCFEKHLKERWNTKLQGDIYRHFQNFEKANESYERALNECRRKDGTLYREDECDILKSLGLNNLQALNFLDSFTWLATLIQLEKRLQRGVVSLQNIAEALTLTGQCVTQMPPMRPKCSQYIKEAEDIWQSLLKSDPENKDFIKGLAELRDTEAFHFIFTHQYSKSLEKYQEAEELFSRSFGQDITNNDTLKVQNGIALNLLRLERFEEAVELFDKVLKQKRSMIGEEVADVNVSSYLRHKGIALSNLGRYGDAVDTFEKSIKIRSKAPGSNFEICMAMANTNHLLADCHFRFGHYVEAIRSSRKVLELVKQFPESGKGKNLKQTAEKIKNDAQKMLSLNERIENNQ